MVSELLQSIDKGAYYAFSEMIKESPFLVQLMQAGDWLGSYCGALALIALSCVFLLARRRPGAAAIVAVTFGVAVAAVELIRHALPAWRPDNAANVVASAEMARSFPAREVFTFTLAGVLLLFSIWGSLHRWLLRLALATVVTVLVLWVAMSQIMLVLHFVTDVAAGLFGGLALALLATRAIAMLPRQAGETP